ncbi:peptide ABC transporter substrate-binding protein [Mannheimia granulomatis]|uniref:Peptide ABC transporter substrate-binding protein n=1 Tax=Mannheimia granulomatis TaxID=85402 RepID=A0A6G8JIP1_9PAST|nr:peptide ABC transporter substrate-binding protein [Mannheimia granulomatis]QIM66971.1 peptide ABC transporter substrate-binding protein [Mannheimia granulomatis]
MFKSLQAVKFVKKLAKITACMLLITACDKLNSPKSTQISPIESHTSELLKRAIYSDIFVLDPHKVNASADAAPLRDLLVGLMAYDAKGDIIPAIAQNGFSEDGKEWLFILNEKAKWSNGDAVTAHDFVASWQRLIEPQNRSSLAKYLVYMGVENAKAIQDKEKDASELGIVALNDHSLQIRLNHPNYLLPEMLAHAALLPTYHGVAPNSENFVSNGAYQLEEIIPNKMVLKAVDTNIPFQTVEYQLIKPVDNYTRFDIVENPLYSQKTNIVKFPRLCSYYYEFNFSDPILSKKEIREALRTMVASAKIGQEHGIPSQSVMPHNLIKDREKTWNPIVVEQLLTKAGIHQDNPLKLKLLYDESHINIKIANQITRTLSQSELFQITPKMVDWETLSKLRYHKEFQLIRSGWCADYPDPVMFLQKFHSRSPDNHSNYKNELVDQKLERLQLENLSLEERNQLILDINELLYHDVAVLPLFQYQHRVGMVSSLLGIDLNNDSEVIYSKDLRRVSAQKD